MLSDRPEIAGMQKEERLLVSLCAHTLGGPQPDADEAFGLDWDRFVNLCRLHRISSVVWSSLSALPWLNVPASASLRLRRLHERNALISLKQAAHLVLVARMLEAEGIPVLPLKGTAIASTYYSSLSMREAGDIDVLVAPEHAAKVDRLLKASGHTRISSKTHLPVDDSFDEDEEFVYHNSYLSPEEMNLEVHTRLNPNRELLPCDMGEIIRTGTRFSIGRGSLPAMGDGMLLMFLATHGARHEWERLQWIYDIALIVQSAQFSTIGEWIGEARKAGVIHPVLQALLMAHRMLGVDVPEYVQEAYRSSRRARFLVQRAENTLFSGQPVSSRPFSLDIDLRLYRFAMTSKRTYLVREVKRGLRAVRSRVSGRYVAS
jgi:hypothetical protein